MGSRQSETHKFIRQIRQAGGEVTLANSGHWKVYVNGHLVTTLGYTCSDVRALKGARSILRKAGLGL